MNNSIILDEKETIERTTPTGNKLALVATGGGGGDEDGRGWLGQRVVGECFLTRNPAQPSDVYLLQFIVIHHSPKSTLLMQELPNGERMYLRVDTIRFSNRYTYFETLGIEPRQNSPKEEEVNSHGTSDQVHP